MSCTSSSEVRASDRLDDETPSRHRKGRFRAGHDPSRDD